MLSQGSRLILGECFLTTLARLAWAKSGSPVDPSEWFTVRFASAVFDLSPAHRSITRVFEVLILLTAIGMLVSIHRHRREQEAVAQPPVGKKRSASSRFVELDKAPHCGAVASSGAPPQRSALMLG